MLPSLALAGCQFSQSTKQPLPITGQCAIKHHLPYVFMISTIIFFVLPMGLILSLYFLIGIKLRQSSRSMGNSTVSTVASINSARLIKKPDLLPSPMTHSPSDSMCPSPKIVKAPHTNENSSSNYNSNSGESNSRHHLHQKGSRLVDGVNYYRAHAASRRAVVKMLGTCVRALIFASQSLLRSISFTITLFHTDDNCFLPPLFSSSCSLSPSVTYTRDKQKCPPADTQEEKTCHRL